VISNDDPFDFLQDPWRDNPQILFDGVRGELPEWFPETDHRELHATRSRLQNYSYDDILKYVNEVRSYWEGSNVTISTPLEIHQEILTLEHFHKAVRLGKEAGLALLTDPKHANLVKKGTNYSKHQSKNASKPRGKVSEDGKTLNEVICMLATSSKHTEESAKELWSHLFSELESLGLNPEEKEVANELKDLCYWYAFKDKRKKITFGQFSNVVSKSRSEINSG